MRNIKRSVLLKTSSITDVLHSGGALHITGLNDIRYNDIIDFKQIKSKDEVVQVVKVAYSGYTPVANTPYEVEIASPNRKLEGWTGYKRKYGFTTPANLLDIGATAALQREYIHGIIIAQINADGSNFVSAVTLATGTGFTITDDAGYFPANLNGGSGGRKGASNISVIKNRDGSGWSQAVEVLTTTTAVYSFGIGTRMADDAPIIYAYTGNLISGEIDAPRTTTGAFAVAGQKYDAFYINSLGIASAHAVTDQLAHTLEATYVFVDNGTGTSTTNLTGFIAFERAMLRELFGIYQSNASAIVDFFDNVGTFSGITTPAPLGTSGTTNNMNSGANVFTYMPNGTATILAPYALTTGIPLSLDATDDEGMELSAPLFASCPKQAVVGSGEWSMYARINLDDVSGTDAFYIGLRKKEAYQTNPDNYDEMATLALVDNTGNINICTILNNAANIETDTTKDWADGETHEIEVRVLQSGVCKFFVDGVDVSAVQAVPYTFDSGEVVVPFISFLNTADIAVPLASRFAFIPTSMWRL